MFADGGYAGDKLKNVLKTLGDWTVEIVKRSDAAKGFVLLPRRWVVERTIACLNRNRRLSKDFEATTDSAAAWLYVARVKLMSRRRMSRLRASSIANNKPGTLLGQSKPDAETIL